MVFVDEFASCLASNYMITQALSSTGEAAWETSPWCSYGLGKIRSRSRCERSYWLWIRTYERLCHCTYCTPESCSWRTNSRKDKGITQSRSQGFRIFRNTNAGKHIWILYCTWSTYLVLQYVYVVYCCTYCTTFLLLRTVLDGIVGFS